MLPVGKTVTWLMLGIIGTFIGADLFVRYCENKISSGLAVAMLASAAAYLLVVYVHDFEDSKETSMFDWEAAKKVVVPLHLFVFIPALGTAMEMGVLWTIFFTACYAYGALEALFEKKDIRG